MPFKHKLSRRLALIRDLSLVGLLALVSGCMDGGPLGSDLDAPGTATRVVGILATTDNPTVAPDQPTPVRAVAVTAEGDRMPVEADWVALDGGELRDTVVNSKHMTYSLAKEPGDYRLVSFDRRRKFRDTTRVTVPRSNSVSIAKQVRVWSPDVCALIGAASTFMYDGFSELRWPSFFLAMWLAGLRVLGFFSKRIVHAKLWYLPEGERRINARKCSHRRRKSDQYLTCNLHLAKIKILVAVTVMLIPRVRY
jgi:hypothetical protein